MPYEAVNYMWRDRSGGCGNCDLLLKQHRLAVRAELRVEYFKKVILFLKFRFNSKMGETIVPPHCFIMKIRKDNVS